VEYGVLRPDQLSTVRRSSMAYPAIPTWGVALSESERALPGVLAQLLALFTEAVHLRNRCLRGEAPADRLADSRDEFDERLLDLAEPRRVVPEYERLAQHLWDHSEQWFTFLTDPRVEATNWHAEQAIRPAVANRKVWGGSQTWAGARAQSVLMSVWRTCWQQRRSALDLLSQLLRGQPVALAQPP
jgi:transposase